LPDVSTTNLVFESIYTVHHFRSGLEITVVLLCCF